MKQTNFRLINFQIGIASADDSGDTGYVVMNLTSNQLMELHYIEDITKSNILMMVKINDSGSGICDAIVGMEPIEIIWTDDSIGKGMEGNVYKQSMIIYDIKDRIIKDGKQSSAVLYCISVDALRNSATKISRRFGKGGGESTSDIVEELITRDLSSTKPFKIDKSITKLSFVSPYWDPYTIISWLAWRSILEGDSGKKSAGYLFFENADGYNFRAMDAITQTAPSRSVNVNFFEEDEDPDEDQKDINIFGFSVSETSDIFRGVNLGSYASTTFTLDMKDFKYEEVPFFINDFYPSVQKLNNRKLPSFYERFGSEEKGGRPTRIMSKILDTAMYTEGTYTQDLTKQLSQSMIRNQLFFNQSATFEYEGMQDLQVGEVVRVNKYNARSGKLEPKLSGKYIVGKIYRQFTTERDMMSTRVTLFRDSIG
tara:strand:- start:1290 stop:2567 length:1278 start_codon:yes stop_codon:yes gene_type:complete